MYDFVGSTHFVYERFQSGCLKLLASLVQSRIVAIFGLEDWDLQGSGYQKLRRTHKREGIDVHVAFSDCVFADSSDTSA